MANLSRSVYAFFVSVGNLDDLSVAAVVVANVKDIRFLGVHYSIVYYHVNNLRSDCVRED